MRSALQRCLEMNVSVRLIDGWRQSVEPYDLKITIFFLHAAIVIGYGIFMAIEGVRVL